MRVIGEIDILHDEALQGRLLIPSAAILVMGLVLTVLGWATGGQPFMALVTGILWGCLATVIALPVHELVHAAAFLLLGGRGHHVSFGFENAFLYTRFHGPALATGRFIAVLLAPTVALTIALPMLGSALGQPLAGWTACFLHLSGCTGDLLMAREILATPGVTHVEDTDSGCRLLG